ncbi:hypothetical protein ACGFK1_06530 [Mycobacterium sp. NPDC048908]|uniref:hypothetical protein n=1 Tax=Mycobacterium sp. NPDC048908 TaxID=3364292 RepID=UPI0037158A8A
MSEKYDVAARLAEGLPAVDNIQAYVWACHVLGYANPDLTLHASQIHDWYGSEDGLDLRALDADCAALESAVAATEDAVARQHEQLGALSAAWRGGAADASREFLRRHGEASAAVAAAVRTSADALATLRDNLWQAVDGKVAAAIAADEGTPDDWLVAAHTVTMGSGDRAAASERVHRDVKPFVDSAIRDGWLTAMRSATAAVTKVYDVATAEVAGEPEVNFDVPAGLGPVWMPAARADGAATAPAAATAVLPSAAPAPQWTAAPAPPPMPGPQPPLPVSAPLPVDPAAAAPAMPAPPSAPSMGAMPDFGSGLTGFGQQLADAFGSLLGTADEGLDTPEVDQPDIDDEPKDEEAEDDESADPAVHPDDEPAVEESVEPASADQTCQPVEETVPVEPPPPPLAEPPPTPVPPPPEVASAPPPEPLAAETPCEIAADELPQVGQ